MQGPSKHNLDIVLIAAKLPIALPIAGIVIEQHGDTIAVHQIAPEIVHIVQV